MKKVVLFTHRIPLEGFEALFARCDVLLSEAYRYRDDELLELLPRVDAVVAGGDFPRALILAASNLRVISNYGAGYERVDVFAATERGIPVTNIPDAVAIPTAELSIALLFAVRRRIAELDRLLRAGKPEDAFGMGKWMGNDLFGSTLGIVGMGSIGGRVARIATALGMKVLYHNRNRLPSEREREYGAVYVPLETLLRESDAVSLHCPLTDETKGMIGAQQLALMKPTAALINTARGGVVDMAALMGALKIGAIAGAGLDVYPHEPHVPDELLTMPNVTLTPHVGTNTFEGRKAMAEACAFRILEVFDGRRPPNVVNPQIYD